MKIQAIFWIWCGCLLVMTVTVAGCIHWIDYPLAAKFLRSLKQGAAVGGLLSGRNIMAGEILVIMALAFTHIWNGDLAKPEKTLLVACSASVMAYTLNSSVLKVIFGRSNPAAFYHGHADRFNLFRGDELSSFPSGHMMLASAFLAKIGLIVLLAVCWFAPNAYQIMGRRNPALNAVEPATRLAWQPTLAWAIGLGILGAVAFTGILSGPPSQFLYFQF